VPELAEPRSPRGSISPLGKGAARGDPREASPGKWFRRAAFGAYVEDQEDMPAGIYEGKTPNSKQEKVGKSRRRKRIVEKKKTALISNGLRRSV